MPEYSTQKIRMVPGGKVFFDSFDANGNSTGEEYTGLSVNFSVNVTTTKVQSYGAESGAQQLDDETIIRTDRNGTLTTRQLTNSNLAKAIIGNVSALTQAGESVTDELHTVQQDRHYQLGQDAATNQTGIRNASALSITDPSKAVIYDFDVDYQANAAALALGRFYVIVGGKIKNAIDGDWAASTAYVQGALVTPPTPNDHFYYATTAGTAAGVEPTWPTDGSTVVDGGVTWQDMGLTADNLGKVLVNYTTAAATRDQVITSGAAEITGALRYLAENIKGPNKDLYGPKVTLATEGDIIFKAADPNYVEITWSISFAEPEVGEALIIDGRPYQLANG